MTSRPGPAPGAFPLTKTRLFEPARRALAVLLGLVLTASGALAESKPVELKWGELAAFAGRNKVEVILRDGASLHGEAVTTRDDLLVMSVTRSSMPSRYSGSATIPKESISLIKVQRGRGTFGRSLGTAVGVIAGLGVGGYAAGHAGSVGPGVSIFVAITAGMTVAGAFAGRALDKRVTRVVIVP